MSAIKRLNIKIIDTLENERQLIFEDTSINSPHLVYNGQEDKLANLNTSELRFNLLVKTNLEGVFFHLFTGSESRFKVILEDVSDVLNPVVKWSGFLLPEQGSESYTYSNFFVDFVATDGIGLLKNKYLNEDYYQDNKSVLDVISKCLLVTGLNLEILFAPAVENAGFDLDYLDLLVNTSSYSKDSSKKSCYDILVLMLESIGCKLFQYNNQWVICGLNHINFLSIAFKKYGFNSVFELNYLGSVTIDRNLVDADLLETPEISVIPVLNEMTTTWDAEMREDLFVFDSFSAILFKKNFVKKITLSGLLSLGSNVSSNLAEDFATPANASLDNNDDYSLIIDYKVFETQINLEDLNFNFLNFKEPIFINKSTDLERYGSLEIELGCRADQFDSSLDYYNLKGTFSSVTDNGFGKGRVVSENHNLETGDHILIEGGGNIYNTYQQVTKVDNNTFDISGDFTRNFLGSYRINPFKGVFYFAITRKDFLDQDDSSAELYLSNFIEDSRPEGFFDFDITMSGFDIKAVLKIDKILFIKDGYYNIRLYPGVFHRAINISSFYEGVSIKRLNFSLKQADTVDVVNKRNLNFSTGNKLDVFHASSQLNLSDKSFLFSDSVRDIVSAASFNGVNYASYYLDKWKRPGLKEELPYLEVLNRIYLGVNYNFNFKVSGTVLDLVFPLDVINFKYKGVRSYTPVVIDNNLVEGTAELVFVENKYTDVAFKTAFNASNSVALVPRIVIDSKAYASGGVNVINTWYKFIDFGVVNAFIEIRGLDSGNINFLYKGVISSTKGAFGISASSFFGSYQIIIYQNGVVSNKEVVNII